MDLLKTEQAKYYAVWLVPEYRAKCHSLEFWHNHQDLFPPNFKSVLDIGCGRGLMIRLFSRMMIDIHGVDFVDNCLDPEIAQLFPERFHNQCLWEMNFDRSFNLGLCIDVMEHIPMNRVADTLSRIKIHCHTVLFKIANYPSNSLGQELHVTQKPAAWWKSQIEQMGGYVIQNHVDEPGSAKYYFTWYT